MQSFLIVSRSIARRTEAINTRLLESGAHQFDTIVVEPDAASIGITAVKTFITNLALLPRHGVITAGVIPHAELLTHEAQQALLKTLEEPPRHVVLFLGTNDPTASLLPTIVSRCQIIAVSDHAFPTETDGLAAVAELLYTLASSSVGTRITHIASIGKTKEEYAACIDRMIEILRDHLRHDPDGKTINLLRNLMRLRRFVANNIHPRLLLEHAFLSLDKANSFRYNG